MQLQWVKGDAEKAEQSFFRNNQQAAPIDKTELRLLKSRRKPNAIAARAILGSGTGHKYWSKFEATASTIESLASEVHTLCFKPPLRTPVKTLDLPVAGKGFSARTLPLIFDFVNLANSNKLSDPLQDDIDGSATIVHLKRCHRVLQRSTGSHPGSLGLHPAVYFYSDVGRYQPTSFLAITSLIRDLEERDEFRAFTQVREQFERFMIEHKSIPLQLVYRYGSGVKGYQQLKALWKHVFDRMKEGWTNEQILAEVEEQHPYARPGTGEGTTTWKDFSKDVKSAAFLREAISNAVRCKICRGLVHINSISIDHVQRKSEGGRGLWIMLNLPIHIATRRSSTKLVVVHRPF